MRTLTLAQNRRLNCWTLNGFRTTAPLDACLENIKETFARMIVDNPTMQHRLGLLGSDGFRFVVRRATDNA